jgi:hypothetical protein
MGSTRHPRVAMSVSRQELIASPGSILWAWVQIMWAWRTCQNQSMWARQGALWRARRPMSASRNSYRPYSPYSIPERRTVTMRWIVVTTCKQDGSGSQTRAILSSQSMQIRGAANPRLLPISSHSSPPARKQYHGPHLRHTESGRRHRPRKIGSPFYPDAYGSLYRRFSGHR